MSELFGIKIPQDPWVVVPCIILATAFCAYLANVVVLGLIRPVVKKTYIDIDNRIYRLLERFLYPLLILGGQLVIEDALPLPPKWLRAAHGVLVVCALLLMTIVVAKVLLNQTVVVRQSLALRGDREVVGVCFTPQDGNPLLSSIAATLRFLDPGCYQRKDRGIAFIHV